MNDSQAHNQSDVYASLVSRVLDIEDITWGKPASDGASLSEDHHYLVRFRGKLRLAANSAYNQLAADLRPYRLAPVFKAEAGRQAIFIIEDPYTPIVSRVFKVEETIWGGQGDSMTISPRYAWQQFAVRFRGRLLIDSQAAYDQIAAQVRALNLTPLFRHWKGQHEVILVRGVIDPRPSNPMVNLVLFVITLFSVILAGTIYSYEGPVSDNPGRLLFDLLSNLDQGIPFAASILAILLAHEFGHYLAGRYHRIEVTLPYFLPFPFSPFGTLGAAIQLKEPPKNKRILLDIGVSGPLAGLVVAIPILLLGLSLSHVDRIPATFSQGQGLTLEGNSILYLLAKYAVFREWLPAPVSFGGLPPLLYWIRYFFTGLPTPLGGTDVLIHPVAWAGWAGLLVTALNLIPAGQLDGGHLIFTLFGTRARALLPLILGAMMVLGLVWSGWWLWALLIFLLGRSYAEPLDQITALDPSRKAIAVLGLIIFVLVFTPVPLRAVAGPGLF